jgi:hypothetical protein
MSRNLSLAAGILAVALLSTSLSTQVHAQGATTNKRTFLTFSKAVQVPGATLPAGKYVFRLADPPTQQVWQVLDAKERHVIASFFYVPTVERTTQQQNAANGKPVVIFSETPEGVPPPVHVLYYPSDLAGSEFIYPKWQAEQLAAAIHEANLPTQANAAIVYSGPEAAEARANPEPAETAAVTAEQTAPQNASEASRPIGTSGSEAGTPVGTTGRNEAATELPKTASPLALIGLVGLLSLAGAAGVRAVRRANS